MADGYENFLYLYHPINFFLINMKTYINKWFMGESDPKPPILIPTREKVKTTFFSLMLFSIFHHPQKIHVGQSIMELHMSQI